MLNDNLREFYKNWLDKIRYFDEIEKLSIRICVKEFI